MSIKVKPLGTEVYLYDDEREVPTVIQRVTNISWLFTNPAPIE